MKKILFLLLIGLTLPFLSKTQQKLTLEQAVLGQYQQFYPAHVFGFEWRGEHGKYSYAKGFQTLVVGVVDGEEKEVLHVSELNRTLGLNIFHFIGVQWKNDSVFVFHNGNYIITFDIKSQKGTQYELPENADNVTFDPTFTYVAYTKENNLYYSRVDQFEEIHVTDYEDANIVSGQAIARSEMGITNGIFWSPSGTKLAFYQKDETEVHDYPLLDITETPGKLRAIKYPMAGESSEKPKVGIFSLDTQSKVYIQTRNGADNYLTNLSWTPDEQFILLAEVARSQKHIWMQKFKASGEFIQTLFEETSNTWVEPERPAYFPFEDKNDFVWVSERDGYDNLYYYSINGELISQLTKNKFVLNEVVKAGGGEVYFTATGENPLNNLVYKVNVKGKQKLLTKEEGTHSVNVCGQGKYIFNEYSTHDIPNISVIRNADGKVVKEMLKANNPLANFDLGEVEIKTIQSEDGTDLYTRLIKPKNFDPTQKYPVLIYVYGGPHLQLIKNNWLSGASLWMHWLADQGYLVFTLDNRGSAGRGVDFEHVIHRELGRAATEDQMLGVEYLKSLPYVDQNRISAHGWSFGGYMTIAMMMENPDDIKVGVAGGAVTDWKFYEVMYGERYMDTPAENPEGYDKTSLLNKAGKLEGSLLMIHGSVDPVVVPQHALAMLQALIKEGKQTDFYLYPMHEHNIMGKDRVHLMEKVLNYILEKN